MFTAEGRRHDVMNLYVLVCIALELTLRASLLILRGLMKPAMQGEKILRAS